MLAKTKFRIFRQLIADISKRNVGDRVQTIGRNSANFVLKSFSQYCGYTCIYILLKVKPTLEQTYMYRIFANRTCTEINVLMFPSYISGYILGRCLINGQPIYIFCSVFAIFIVISAVFLKFSKFFLLKKLDWQPLYCHRDFESDRQTLMIHLALEICL